MTRPRGLTATAVVVALYDLVWYVVFHWTGHNTLPQIVVSTGGVWLWLGLLWYYCHGSNWARLMMIWFSVLGVGDLVYWNQNGVSRPMLGFNAMFGAFLIWWLNTKRVRTFFRPDRAPSKAPSADLGSGA